MQRTIARLVRNRRLCLFGGVALLLSAPGASADQLFATEESFLAAASGPLEVESFEGLPLDPDITQGSLALPGLDLLSQADRLGVRKVPKPGVDRARYVVYNQEPGSTLTLSFDAPVTEFGTRIMDPLDRAAGTISVRTNGGSDFGVVFTAPLVNDDVHYLGIITDVPFTTLTFTHTVPVLDGILLDAVRFNIVREPGDGCPPIPMEECRGLAKRAGSKVDLKVKKGKLAWMWKKGVATDTSAFGDPTAPVDPTHYDLCIYDEERGVPSLVASYQAPAGDDWKKKKNGFNYRNNSPDLLRKAILRAGPEGKAKVTEVQGKGLEIPLLPFKQDPRVIVQLINDTGECWGTEHSGPAKHNDETRFRDKADQAD